MLFWVYACLLFTLTHWPRFRIVSPIDRPDLIAHAVAFATWTILLTSASYFGALRSWRNLWACLVVGLLYACLDEGLQAVPILHRSARLDDLLANFLGVGLGTLIMLAFIGITRRPVSQ